jgi:ABC-2 type transport system ATP-binding protein
MKIEVQAAIQTQNLSKIYKSRGSKEPIAAVNQLNLNIAGGQVFGFLGANGAGKTTTIKMMCGLVKATEGAVFLNGFHVEKEKGQAMRQIGAVLEGTRNVYWRMSALENINYFGRLKGVYGKVLKENAELLLHELDLWERRNDKIRNFSRGMQQKVAIACALVSDPPIVLLDEPTLGLDVKAALTVKHWIASLAKERNKTVILTTHQLDMAQELCDRVAIINKGQLLTNLPTEELLSLARTEYYEIKVKGHMNGEVNEYEQNALTVLKENDSTILTGAINSQDELFTVLNKLRTQGFPLVSVKPLEPNLEEIFMKYIEEEQNA